MAEILLSSVYQTNDAALQDNVLKTASTPLGYDPNNAVTSYKFISLPPDAPSFSGNNAIGVLEVTYADGSMDLYKGEISRQYKLSGNQVEAFQFYAYPSDGHNGYNKTPSATYLLDVGNQPLTPNTTYKTSSDFKPAGLDAFINHNSPEVPLPIHIDPTDTPIPPTTPVDPGWVPGEPDVTPDPTNGEVIVVPPSTPDNPKDPGNEPHDEVVQLNNGVKEDHVIDVKDPTTPDHKPPPNTVIEVSTDGGETWQDHKPGDHFTTGDKDTLVIVDTHNNPNPTPPHDLLLIVDGGTPHQVITPIAPLDQNLHVPNAPHITPPPPAPTPIVGVAQYDDHGVVCYL